MKIGKFDPKESSEFLLMFILESMTEDQTYKLSNNFKQRISNFKKSYSDWFENK